MIQNERILKKTNKPYSEKPPSLRLPFHFLPLY